MSSLAAVVQAKIITDSLLSTENWLYVHFPATAISKNDRPRELIEVFDNWK